MNEWMNELKWRSAPSVWNFFFFGCRVSSRSHSVIFFSAIWRVSRTFLWMKIFTVFWWELFHVVCDFFFVLCPTKCRQIKFIYDNDKWESDGSCDRFMFDFHVILILPFLSIHIKWKSRYFSISINNQQTREEINTQWKMSKKIFFWFSIKS